jgi:hypothetical protein
MYFFIQTLKMTDFSFIRDDLTRSNISNGYTTVLGGTPGSPYNPFPPFGKFSSLPVSITTNKFRKPT